MGRGAGSGHIRAWANAVRTDAAPVRVPLNPCVRRCRLGPACPLYRDGAHLLEHTQVVKRDPHRDHLAVAQVKQVESLDLDPLPSRRDVPIRPGEYPCLTSG